MENFREFYHFTQLNCYLLYQIFILKQLFTQPDLTFNFFRFITSKPYYKFIIFGSMKKRIQPKKMDLSFSEDEDYQIQEDSLNQDYVQKKRAAKKGGKKGRGRKLPQKREKQQSQDSNQSQEVIQFKHQDDQIKQHYRPTFMQRWNGIDNQIQIFSEQYEQMSPMFKVYWETKCKNMNAIIFLQLGGMEFFAFENDAIILHQIFKKKLKKFSSFLMVNFWCKQIVLAKQELFGRGIPVLTMNQINDPVYKMQNKIIRREINQVITPGIHLDMEDKAYKQRWFMAFYVHDVKVLTQKKIRTLSQERNHKQENGLKKACVILLDSQSNKFFIQQFEVDEKLHDVRRVINRYRPVQLLLPKNSSMLVKNIKQIARQICSPYIIQIGYERQNQKMNQTLEKFIKNSQAPIFKQLLSLSVSKKKHDSSFQMYSTVKCLDLIYEYLSNLKLKEKIFDEGIFQISCFNQAKLKPFFDSQVYENLQIFRIKNQDQGQSKKGTLIAYLDFCLTNSGKKLLRRWLNQPLVTIEAIQQRQQCIKQIVENQHFALILTLHQKLIAYQKLQKKIADIYHWVVKGYEKNFHKLTGDLSFEKGYDQKKNPAVVRIKQILKILNLLKQFQSYLGQLKQFKLKSKYFKKLTHMTSLNIKSAKKVQKGQQKIDQIPQLDKIIQSIVDKIDYNQTTDFLQPTAGHYQQYDAEKKQKTVLQNKLEAQLQKWRSHFKNNKISFINVRARNQIQIPKGCLKSRKDKPKQLIFSSQTSTYERFTTAKTIELSDQLMIHQQRLARSYEPFMHDIIDEFCQFKFVWNRYVQAISEIDVVLSIAYASKRMIPRCLPTFCLDDQNSLLDIKKALHPGLVQVLEPQQLVSNTLNLKKEERFLLLTGPNMGGKSTLLRQTCLLAILAQIGSYLPCQKYQAIVFDQIFCRIGSSDRIIQGKSTFYVELQETNRILNQATSSSLVIIDELGRGTSTYDGMAIAQATIQYILQNIGCYTLFSTHYTPITRDFLSNQQVKCAKMSYKLVQGIKKQENQVNEQKLSFLYQVEPGIAEKSFANNVARMVGLPEQILKQADKKAQWISQLHEQAQKKWKKTKNINLLVDLGIVKAKNKDLEM